MKMLRRLPRNPKLTTSEVVGRLGISEKTFAEWRKRYNLPEPQFRDKRSHLWDFNAIVEVLREKRGPF